MLYLLNSISSMQHNTYSRDASVIGQHETGDAVRCAHVGRLPRKCHLDRSWSPRYKLRQFPLTDSLQTLVDLSRINLSLQPRKILLKT